MNDVPEGSEINEVDGGFGGEVGEEIDGDVETDVEDNSDIDRSYLVGNEIDKHLVNILNTKDTESNKIDVLKRINQLLTELRNTDDNNYDD